MSMIVMENFKAVDASFSIKFNIGLIPRFFKSSVSYAKARIIYLLLLLFIAVASMALQSYKYITYIFFPLLYVVGKRPYRYE